MTTEDTQSLHFTFNHATEFLGFNAEEKVRLLSGPLEDVSLYTRENIGNTVEALAQLGFALGLMLDDDAEVGKLMRDKTLPDLSGESIADCVLSKSPEKVKRAIAAAEIHLDLN